MPGEEERPTLPPGAPLQSETTDSGKQVTVTTSDGSVINIKTTSIIAAVSGFMAVMASLGIDVSGLFQNTEMVERLDRIEAQVETNTDTIEDAAHSARVIRVMLQKIGGDDAVLTLEDLERIDKDKP